MNIRRIFIPGQFQDVYLYRGWLIALTQYRTLRFLDLSSASENLSSFVVAASERSIFRSSSEFEHGLITPYSHDERTLDTESIATPNTWSERDLKLDARVVLDLAVYKYHLYVGTDKGLFS